VLLNSLFLLSLLFLSGSDSCLTTSSPENRKQLPDCTQGGQSCGQPGDHEQLQKDSAVRWLLCLE